mgnify:FL=1
MTPEQIAAAAAILIAAYFIRGITGFGSGLISVPLLALFLPLTFVVPLVLLLDFTASLVIGGVNRQHVRWRELLILIVPSIVGVGIGTHLLVSLPQTPMLVGLAIFVLLFAIKSLLNIHGDKPISQAWAVPAALTGGTVGGLFGTGGPPYVIYLSHRIRDKSVLRATLSALFFVEGLTRIITFVVAGLLMSREIWIAYLAGLPIVLGVLYAGGRVHHGMSAARMERLIGGLLLISSMSLLIKAFS